ncbi:MAG: acetyltransferase [Desulfobacterales bacterium]|nr:acetyltransferase [Desulfobacterales bacterium]
MHYDVFNGDADGICALHQLRLAEPRPTAGLVTGVKRDIRLLDRLTGIRGAEITVLDISLDSNRAALEPLLANNKITYIDHHFAGEIPDSPQLVTHIDPSPGICTGLIVNQLLNGRFRAWAVVAAFGDNLHQAAAQAAAPLGLSKKNLAALRELGELINYNGYGASIADLHFPPGTVYADLRPYLDPLAWLEQSELLQELRQGFAGDMARARACEPIRESAAGRIFQLPAAAWARRVSGVFSNEKARERPDLAHALLVENPDHSLRISVRAPLADRRDADLLCRLFPGGGGRAAAAGINALPPDRLSCFIDQFNRIFSP